MGWVDAINRHASLISAAATVALAVLTGLYVVFTRRSLKAFQRASVLGLRQRHLEDIKQAVERPIRGWLEQQVLPGLAGKRTAPKLVAVVQIAVPRPRALIGEPAYKHSMRLACTLRAPEDTLADGLFRDVKDNHFPKEMRSVDKFLEGLPPLVDELERLAGDAADRAAAAAVAWGLPTESCSETHVGHFADSDSLTAACLCALLAGEQPTLRYEPGPDRGATRLRDTSDSNVLACGPDQAVREWAEAGRSAAAERWQASGLPARVAELKRDAEKLSRALLALERTYELPGACGYVAASD